MLRQSLLLACALVRTDALLLGVRPAACAPAVAPRLAPARMMALDVNDPNVAKEFQALQGVDTDDIVDELGTFGIKCPPTMNDMEMRMMLIEVRMRKAGTFASKETTKKAKPTSFGSKFEEAMWEKPAFKALYEKYQAEKLVNSMNLASEHLNNAKRAKDRYAGTAEYDKVIAEIEEALNTRIIVEVTSPKLMFSGFPSNMGEAGVKMTLQAFGPVVDIVVEESDDGMTLSGRVEYEDVATAKQAVDKYDGVDMGLGTTLELQSV